ncbi:MAG: DNA-binding protein [Paludibacteraceae bacterium]|nr:DNA-binding protein [Paludibacteraceae bacterium]
MALNISSKLTTIKLGPHKDEEMYVMKVNHYNTLNAEKVIQYASDTSNIPKAVLRASWEALGSAITAWTLEGHIVEIPGLGNIRAEVRAKAQSRAEDVSESDIFRRKLLLTPTKEIKDALNATPVKITCYDRDGNVIKR